MTTEEIAALAAAISAGVLVVAAYFAWRQLRAFRQGTEAQLRPYVVVDLDWRDPPLIHIYIQNMGRTMARNVSVTFDPPLDSTFDDERRQLSQIALFTTPIPTLAPNKRYETLFDVGHERARQELTDNFKVTVRYEADVPGRLKRATYEDDMEISVDVLWGIEYTTVRTLKDVYKELKQIKETLRTWSAGLGRGSGLVVKTPHDIREERGAFERAREERRRGLEPVVEEEE